MFLPYAAAMSCAAWRRRKAQTPARHANASGEEMGAGMLNKHSKPMRAEMSDKRQAATSRTAACSRPAPALVSKQHVQAQEVANNGQEDTAQFIQ